MVKMTKEKRQKYWWLIFVPFVNVYFILYCLFDVFFGEE